MKHGGPYRGSCCIAPHNYVVSNSILYINSWTVSIIIRVFIIPFYYQVILKDHLPSKLDQLRVLASDGQTVKSEKKDDKFKKKEAILPVLISLKAIFK